MPITYKQPVAVMIGDWLHGMKKVVETDITLLLEEGNSFPFIENQLIENSCFILKIKRDIVC
ncbi:hypothetical protein EMIT0210MI2_11379 [Priestia megaterium]